MFENLIFVFIIGFLSGVGFISILFFLRKTKSSEIKDDTDLTSLKNHMQSIQPVSYTHLTLPTILRV